LISLLKARRITLIYLSSSQNQEEELNWFNFSSKQGGEPELVSVLLKARRRNSISWILSAPVSYVTWR
jgi:hypothetical protein